MLKLLYATSHKLSGPLLRTTLAGFIVLSLLITACRTADPVAETTDPETAVTEETGVTTDDIPLVMREQRAGWIATVANINWPSEPGLTVEEQQEELIFLFDRAAAMNMNAVIFQVRPAADAMYDSPYEPWAGYLTGQMGQAPEPWYDPLEFAINEAHIRGLELHAWFNPYRAGHPADPSDNFSEDHVSHLHPEWVLEFGDYLWFDPGLPEASEHSKRVMLDVATRYDVDGVHLDDYFYPYPSYEPGVDFPDDVSWQRAQEAGVTMSRHDWRRNNVDMFIKELYEELKEVAPQVKFGISPIGVHRPNYPEGAIFGFDAYEAIYADAQLWINEGWLDNFIPQLYHTIDNPGRSFPAMLHWWQEQNLEGRHVWAGKRSSAPPEEVAGQIYTARAHPGVTGTVHWSMNALVGNPTEGRVDHIARDVYRGPALIPTYPWLGDTPPTRPEGDLHTLEDRLELTLRAGSENDEVRWWVIRSDMGDYWEVEVAPGSQNRITYHGSEATVWPSKVVVSAVDRLGNESESIELVPELDERGRPVVEAAGSGSQTGSASAAAVEKPDIIARADWADEEPGGREANAVRRNFAEGDRLTFRDLTIVLEEMIPGKKTERGEETTANGQIGDGGNDNGYEEAAPDSVRLSLYRYGVHEERTVPEGYAFNWYGYHIGAVAVNSDRDVLAGGLSELEISTVASISRPPVARAALQETGGANNRLRVPHRIGNITLHHTGSPEPLTEEDDPVERLNSLYEWSSNTRGWWDLPYHYLIDLDGTIYEGRDYRFAGDTNTNYNPAGHLVIGMLGNFNRQESNEDQLDAITRLMAWASDTFDVPAEEISGHYNWADSGCPGDHLRPLLEDGTIQQRVHELLERSR